MAIARTRLPRGAAQTFFREIRRRLKASHDEVRRAYAEELRPRIGEYRASIGPAVNALGNDALDEIRRVLDRLRRQTETRLSATVLERLADMFVTAVNRQSAANWRQQALRVVGFDPTANEPWLSSFLETAVQENVSLIKTIAASYHDKVESIVLQGARRGTATTEMAGAIADAGTVALRRAKFIARDQLGSLHGDLTRRRQMELGLRRFRWSTSGDDNVRDSHRELDGKVFTWQDGAINERGERIWPGTDYNCRCVAEPLEEELLEVADSG